MQSGTFAVRQEQECQDFIADAMRRAFVVRDQPVDQFEQLLRRLEEQERRREATTDS
jgi:hypothetical protein